MLGLACPLQLRVKMRVVGIGLPAGVLVGVGRHKADRRVVHPLLAGVGVDLNVLGGFFLALAISCSGFSRRSA